MAKGSKDREITHLKWVLAQKTKILANYVELMDEYRKIIREKEFENQRLRAVVNARKAIKLTAKTKTTENG